MVNEKVCAQMQKNEGIDQANDEIVLILPFFLHSPTDVVIWVRAKMSYVQKPKFRDKYTAANGYVANFRLSRKSKNIKLNVSGQFWF